MTHSNRLSGPDMHDDLRLNAESVLQNDSTHLVGRGSLGVEALELLYRRASDPEFAADALKLLHELRTHQVELDLVFDQMQSTEIELSEALEHYKAFYDMAPVAYLLINADGLIIENNKAASNLFGLSEERLVEQPLENFLSAHSRVAVKAMLQKLKSSGSGQRCVVDLSGELGSGHRQELKVKQGSTAKTIFCVFSPEPATAQS